MQIDAFNSLLIGSLSPCFYPAQPPSHLASQQRRPGEEFFNDAQAENVASVFYW